MKSEDCPQYFSAQHSDRISYSQSGRFEAHALSHIQVWARRNARGCMFLPHPLAHNFLRKPKKITKNTLTLWLKERDKSLWINTFSICCAYLLQHSFNNWNHSRQILCFLPSSRKQDILETKAHENFLLPMFKLSISSKGWLYSCRMLKQVRVKTVLQCRKVSEPRFSCRHKRCVFFIHSKCKVILS